MTRTWTVELRLLPQGPFLVCPQCSSTPGTVPGRSARAAVLAHLAQHARTCALPQHLKTCQCHERGCRWHARHRGCAGPVLLVLARERGGRLWRLTDACTACAHAMENASVVPDTRIASSPLSHRPGRSRGRHTPDPETSTQLVRQMLSYVACCVPPHTTPRARLLALQAVLRATGCGRVRLHRGLVLSLGHGPMDGSWAELVDGRLITPEPGTQYAGWLTDPVIGMPGLSGRRSAADWALRAARRCRACGLGPGGELLSVTLNALTDSQRRDGVADAEQLAHLCGLAPTALADELDRLVARRALACWRPAPTAEETTWRLS